MKNRAAREARKRKSDIESVQQQKKLKMDEAKAITAEIDKKLLSWSPRNEQCLAS